jgi:hypothetical protein
MSKSTNTVVYFDWKTVIYSYVCGKCRTQFMLPMEKSVTFTGACANEIIPSINRLFDNKAKEGRHVRIFNNLAYFACFTASTMTWLNVPEYLFHKWPRIRSVFRNHNPILSSIMTYHRVCNKSNTTGSTSGEGTDYPSGAPELTPVFLEGPCCPIFSFLCSVL